MQSPRRADWMIRLGSGRRTVRPIKTCSRSRRYPDGLTSVNICQGGLTCHAGNTHSPAAGSVRDLLSRESTDNLTVQRRAAPREIIRLLTTYLWALLTQLHFAGADVHGWQSV